MGGGRRVWHRLRSDRRAVLCMAVLALEVLCVLLLPPLLGLEPNVTDRTAGFWAVPSAAHWLENTGKTTAKVLWIATPPSF